MLEVELAALDGWARSGSSPRTPSSGSARPRDRRPRSGSRSSSGRRTTTSRRSSTRSPRRSARTGAGSTSASRRRTSSTRRSRSPCRRRGRSCSTGSTGRFAPSSRARRSIARRSASGAPTASMPSRRRSASSSPAGRSRSSATGVRLEHALSGLRVGKLSGAVGTYAAIDPEVERIACERLGLEPAPSSTQILQRDRHAELLAALALAGVVARPVRDGDPPSRAHGGARGRGAVRARPEGLVRDAAQAQPDHRRADLRPRARRARERARRPRERRALARARHLALVRRADRAARLVPRDRLHARPVRLARRGARRQARSGCGRTSRRATGSSSASVCCSRSSRAGSRRDDAYRLVQRHAMRAWDEELDFRELVRADAEIAGRVDLDARVRRSTRTPRTSTPCSTGSGRSSPRGRPPSMPETRTSASGKVRELYALGRRPAPARRQRSHLDVRRRAPDGDPGQGARADRPLGLLVRAHAPDRPEPSPRAAPRRPLARVPAARDAARRVVVRGYLAGSGWMDYRRLGCGLRARAARRACASPTGLPEPIVTPATKATEGHDVNITETRGGGALRRASATRAARDAALALYGFAASHAEERGIIVADTKFELGDRRGRDGHARRRGAHPRLVPLLARRRVRAGRPAAVVRQAVRARLVPRRPAGTSTAPGPELPARRRRRNAGPLRRGVRAAHGDRRSTTTSPTRRSCCDGDGPRSGRRPGSSTRRARPSRRRSRTLGFVGHERARRPAGRPRGRRRRHGRRRAREVERMCTELLANPLIESFEIVDGGRRDVRAVLGSPSSRSPARTTTATRASPLEHARRRAASRLARRDRAARRTSAASSCRAASRTATTSAAARSPASRP